MTTPPLPPLAPLPEPDDHRYAASFATRCRLAQECLPDAEYRQRLTALHDEMLAAIAGSLNDGGKNG